MQCKKCGSEWKTNARASLIIRCPFCGAELEEEKEDKLTFQDAKEALRYIVKTYGVDVIIDGIQLRALLDEFIPDLKQERKVFMDAYEQGMCNALYLAHDESEIDKCIAILQSIKVLTTDACMAEKWASYVVECFVYALDWSVPMFGITPNIHMHQMPENIREPNRRLISAGDAFEDNYNDGAAEPEKESRSSIFGFFHNDEPKEDGTVSVTVSEDKETAEQAAKIKDEKTETKPEEKDEKPQRPIFDFTDETEEEKKDEKAETKPEEKDEKPQRPIFDFTDEAEGEKKDEALRLYAIWSAYGVETEGVLVAYASIHGNTAKAAEQLAEILRTKGAGKVAITDLSRDDMAEAIEDAFRMDKLVLCCATYDGDIFPAMHMFLHKLRLKGYQNRRVALVENGSWAPQAVRVMKDMLSGCKNIEIVEPTVTIRGALKPEQKAELETLADALLK